jgi:hypothetical protein
VPQIFDPRTGELTTGTPEAFLRGYHNIAVLQPDGRVLLGGGRTYRATGAWFASKLVRFVEWISGGLIDVTDYQRDERTDLRYYSPPYLAWPELRPTITRLSSTEVRHGADLTIHYENGSVDRAILISLGSQTHSMDINHRFIELPVTKVSDGQIRVSIPDKASVAPPGHYMLFVTRSGGDDNAPMNIPSVAQIVRVRREEMNGYAVHRDDEGRVVRVNGYPVHYDEQGRVVRMNGYAVEYDEQGRVVRMNGYAVQYDEQGRVVRMNGYSVHHHQADSGAHESLPLPGLDGLPPAVRFGASYVKRD